MKKKILLAVLLILGGGVGLRLAGLIDFPLYDADPRIGYIPRANQAGVFLDRNHWQINEKSQGSRPWHPDQKTDLLLLGDSIVWGGNPLDQPQKLGPSLERRLPDVEVWSASAGSWGVPNEVEYMDRFPEVIAASEVLVWVLNSGDLGRRSQWASQVTHPRHRPVSALWYALQKYGEPRLQALWPSPAATAPAAVAEPPPILPETEALFHARLKTLAEHAKVLVVIWPDRPTTAGDAAARAAHQEFSRHVRQLAAPPVQVLDLLENPPPVADYRDGIHPSPAGNEYLADKIAAALQR